MMDTVAAARAVQGRIAGSPVVFARVTTDSRAVARGDLFVALKGEHFDGHDFVAQAFADGAAAALVAADRAATLAGNLIEVPDPLAALGALARHWRAGFDLPVVAVVGSNGKTTTKEMIATIFREAIGGQHVLATAGNFNNAIGLPLTLLRLRGAHRLAVVEIGMNHRGETAELAAIAQATIAVVANAQREHQEFMRSVAEVAAEHADLVRALPEGGVAVLNADDEYVDVWREAARAAIDVLAHATGKRWLALGDMGEVGAQGPAFHREVGEYARAAGIEGLCAVGESAAAAVAAFGAAAAHFATVDDLAAFIVAQAGRGDTVLVKGSRFMRMERVVAALAGGNTGDGH